MDHEDYIKKRDEILYSMHGVNKGDVPFVDRSIAAAAQAIDALVLEVIGESTYEEGMTGDDKTATRYADFVKSEQRRIVQGDKS